MNFRTYRRKMGWTLTEAAEMLGLKDGSTVAKHEIGACMPSGETMARYEKLTGGEVTSGDFADSRRRFRVNPDAARARIGARTLQKAASG